VLGGWVYPIAIAVVALLAAADGVWLVALPLTLAAAFRLRDLRNGERT
jgi:hypothetical protein